MPSDVWPVPAGRGWSDGASAASSFSSSLPESGSSRRTPAVEEEACGPSRRRPGCCVCCEGGCECGRGVTNGDSGERTGGSRPRAGRAGDAIL